MSPRAAALLPLLSLVFPGPASGQQQPNPEWIRVAIVRDQPEVELQVHGAYSLHALPAGNLLDEAKRLHRVQVRPTAEGLALGEQELPVEGVRIIPLRDAAINLNGKRLRGELEIMRQDRDSLQVVNELPLEDYLRGVLSKEAPDYWPEEALKAIAIAARTYAVHRKFSRPPAQYDVTGDVMSQDYGGKTSEKAATSRAVKATAGLIVMYKDQLFPTFYHSTCGGMTERGTIMGSYDIEPLRGGIGCQFCSASPFYAWTRRLTVADVAWALKRSQRGSVGTVRDLRVSYTPTGRAHEVTVVGSNRTMQLSGFDFRKLFGFEHIRSLRFSPTRVGDEFVLEGHGWGHGVGLCQWGAAELARRGLSAAEILAIYYPGAELVAIGTLNDRAIRVVGAAEAS